MTENFKSVKKKIINEVNKENERGGWLATDPSGHSKSGYMIYRNDGSWDIGTFEDEKWQNHAKFFWNVVKNENIKYWGIETTGRYLKTWASKKGQGAYMAESFFSLLNCCGGLLLIADVEGVEVKEVINFNVNQWEKKAKEGSIPGLKYTKIRKYTEHYKNKGILVPAWTFKNKVINDHEKDAVIIFYLYYVKYKYNDWPFKDE
jgi:hypothetical protein